MTRTILIVDDIKSNRDILRNMLGSDYRIMEAAHGQEALAIMNRDHRQISAVLLDLGMPVMDGYEVLSFMQRNEVLSQLPVIVTTGQTDSSAEERALTLGAMDYISKPYKSAIIKQRIQNTINLRETAATVNAMQRDRLTGLLSREAFFDQVSELVASRSPGYYVMACFDIDSFKVINDQYGTEKGDEVLRHIAGVFQSGFESNGGICSRITADNFAVLYPADFRSSAALADIRRRAAAVEGLIFPIIFSIGRYIVDDPAMLPSMMYDRAMLAAVSVKGHYGDKIAIYDETMRARLLHEQEIVTEMENALNTRQFEPWYQPQYNHATGALIGAEALVRWRHPTRGMISPGTFIPVFEKNGFIYALDRYVWESVCRYLRGELDAGRSPLPVSVNISRYDVFRPDIVDVITGLVQKYDLPPALLRLEITESAFAESTKLIVKVVKALVERGFMLEIDDFGSGYSSLNTLKCVPAQVLKLDMRFLEQDEEDTQRGGNIVESVVRMTKWLGMSVIAEGVETKAQADYLETIGCSYIQGYFYARPMPEDDYRAVCAGAGKEEKLLTMETVENLDNNSFWDPESMDTLIFNSYAGNACIFEYQNGSIELLRTTQKFAQIFGSADITIETALKLDWAKHLSPDTAQRVQADLRESIATRSEVGGEYVFLDLPGCPRETYLRSAVRVIAAAGDRYLVYCINENITAQRQAELREREVTEQMRLIMANMNGGICALSFDAGGKAQLVFANDRFYSLYGYTREQMAAEIPDILDLIDPADRAAADTTIARLFTDRIPCEYDNRCIRRDGSGIYVHCSASLAVVDGQNDVMITAISDVTKIVLAEQRALKVTEQLQAIMSNVDVGIVASIFRNGKSEFLFSNDKFYALLGYTRSQFAKEVSDPYDTVAPEIRREMQEATVTLLRAGRSGTLECPMLRRDGSRRLIRNMISVGHFAGIAERVQLSIIRDITEEKEAEQRERRSNEQVQAIMSDIGSGITASVLKDGEFELLFSNERFYEMRGCTRETFHRENKGSFSFVCAEDRDRVYQAMVEAYRTREPRQIEYRITRWDGSERWIRLGMSSTRFTGVEQNVILCIYTDVTVEKQAEWEVRETSAQMQSMMNDMPGGFVRMRVLPDGGVAPDYLNDGFLRLTGMDRKSLLAQHTSDPLKGVHPDDSPMVEAAIARITKYGESRSPRYRLRRADGSYVWLMFFGRATGDPFGDRFLNLYFTDMTEQLRTEEQQKELLDNLPGGAALYEFDGENLCPIHINKRYWELVDRTPAFRPDVSVLTAIHPEDRAIILHELFSAARENRDAVCDHRIKYGDGGEFRPFHVVARVIPKGDGKYSVYAAYTPISDEAMSIQEMLPIALGAVMDSQTEYTFVKNKNLRYVCCSRQVVEIAGRSSEAEMLGRSDHELFDKALADVFYADDRRVLESGESLIDNIDRLPAVNGVDRYACTSKFPLKDSQGNIVGVYGLGRDITEDRAMKSQFKLLSRSIPGGIASYEFRDGGFSLLDFSDGFCRLFGLNREEYAAFSADDIFAGIPAEELPGLKAQLDALVRDDAQVDCVFRVRPRDGSHKWINLKAASAERDADRLTFNAVFFDVTQRQDAIERMRISEEENRLAMQHTSNAVCRYDIASRTLRIAEGAQKIFAIPATVEDVPFGPIERGVISPDTAAAYMEFYESIRRGSKTGTASFRRRFEQEWHWLEAHFSTIFSDAGAPVSAVISFMDVTEQLEKDSAYKRWQQTFQDKAPESYSLFRSNISKRNTVDSREGSLLTVHFAPGEFSFDQHTMDYVAQCVLDEDRERFSSFLKLDTLLANYYQGKHTLKLEYREKLDSGRIRWLRLTVDLVEYPHSSDVEAYLLFEDIDEAKRAELAAREQAESDPLTGVMNRVTFASQMNHLIRLARPNTLSVLMMLDIDGFKKVNDAFGHCIGDEALVDIAGSLRSVLRTEDLVGRLGGDEFVIFLTDVANDAIAANKAQQICALVRKSYSIEVEISGSIGIAAAPRDGADFDTLYRKADAALYYVKGSGKDDYAFYHEEMADQHLSLPSDLPDRNGRQESKKKRRILIVDDNRIDHAMMANIFAEDFIVEKAKDGAAALVRLRHYGAAISVVLLDLVMPGMDGFAVLKKMQESIELRNIPVIVVSGDESRETSLRAIRAGAVDFVTKPVDPDILHIRVQSAISKAENERLRSKNSLLEFQNSEVVRYRTVLERSGIVVIEHDWVCNSFVYDPHISDHILGTYDDRKLWHILLSDFVADTKTVKQMQELVHAVAQDRKRSEGALFVQLRTPAKEFHWFKLCIYKVINEFGLTGKLFLTFSDLGTARPEPLAQ